MPAIYQPPPVRPIRVVGAIRYPIEVDQQALELVRTFVADRKRFAAAAANAPVGVVAALIRIAQPSYRSQFRSAVVGALAGGTVTSAITWAMAGHPRTAAAREARLYKTVRNALLGMGVSVILSVMRHTTSPERDALAALRQLNPGKVRDAEKLLAAGFRTPLLPQL